MKIVFTDHAEIKIGQRKIPRFFVVKTVKTPDFTKPGHGFKEELYRKFKANYLKVVIRRKAQLVLIITAHWIAKMNNL